MAKQTLNLEIEGLKTFYSPQLVNKGAMVEATNVNLEEKGRIETRRGLKEYIGAVSSTMNSMVSYSNTLMLQYGDRLAYLNEAGTPTWTDIVGSGYAPPNADIRIKYAFVSSNMYYTSDNGVFKIDSPSATPRATGMPRGLGGSVSSAGAGNAVPAGNQVAYRIVWGYTDENENLILGAPSERVIYTNATAGTEDVNIQFAIPGGVVATDFFQIYRSGASGGAAIEPDDNLSLIYEANPTGAEITAGVLNTITDSTPDDLRGAQLYTSIEGINNSNFQPPLAVDLAEFKNVLLYANTKTRHILDVAILAVGSPNGVQIGDQITIDGVVYTGGASENSAIGQFLIDTSGTIAQNIDSTARSLVRVVNEYATNTTIDAFYVSGFNDTPGKMQFIKNTLSPTPFTFDANANEAAYRPNLTTEAATSDNEEKGNRVYFSKIQEPEAVPILNYLDVGSENFPIIRMVSLRDSVFFFKEDGIFRLSGEDPNSFTIFRFDNTVEIIAPEAAVVFDNQIYLMTNQGVVAVNDGGVVIKSRAIEDIIRPKQNANVFTNFESKTFAISYESDRKYIFFTTDSQTSTTADIAYVYNSLSDEWTSWALNASCGTIRNSDDKIYTGLPTLETYIERKELTTDDYADREINITIDSYNSSNFIMKSRGDLIGVGWGIKQGSSIGTIESQTVITDNITSVVVDGSEKVLTISKGDELFTSTAYSPYTNIYQANLNGPDLGNFNFTADLLLSGPGGAYFSDALWLCTDSIGSSRSWVVDGGPTTVMPINYTPVGGSWNSFAASTENGLKRYYFPKFDNDDQQGGYIEWYYDRDKFFDQLNGTTDTLVIGLDGSAFAYDGVTYELLTTTDGKVNLGSHRVVQGAISADTTSIKGNEVRVDSSFAFTTGNATIYSNYQKLYQNTSIITGSAMANEPIPVRIEFTPQYAGNTGMQKHWNTIIYLFDEFRANLAIAGFRTDYSRGEEDEELRESFNIAWGEFSWGEQPWGGEDVQPKRIRRLFPTLKRRSFRADLSLEMNEAFARFALNGISIIFDAMEDRQKG